MRTKKFETTYFFDYIHLAGSAGCLEYLTIANLYLFINNKGSRIGRVSHY